MAAEVSIRQYEPGRDDETWVSTYNRARAEVPEFVPLQVEELEREQKKPWFKADGEFIAELDGVAVGTVRAYLRDSRKLRVGFVDGPNVVPEARRRGVGSALMHRALESLRQRGATAAEDGAGDWNAPALAFLRKHGFEPLHTYSRMERDLGPVPTGIGESREVVLQPFGESDEEVATWHGLIKAAFAEHHNFEVMPLSEFLYFARHQRDGGGLFERWFALLDGVPVGYLIIEIDPQENEKLGKRRGWVNDIGVLKEHRGRGIATRLLLRTLERLQVLGMESAVLSVDDQNVTGARRVYERVGFRVVRRYTSFELTLTPTL
jgi:ribosomal protein S18 acetylase RimI-like enzyme